MIKEGVVNDTKNWALLVDQSNGDADKGKSMNEVGCAIFKFIEQEIEVIIQHYSYR